MSILLAFAPFIVFALLNNWVSSEAGLIGATLTALLLIGRDALRGKPPKLLELGAVALFGGLAIGLYLAGQSWPLFGVRLATDGGLFLIVLIPMLVGRPFTLAYAREQTTSDIWERPEFIRINYLITAVWALAFAVMAAADVVMMLMPGAPFWGGIAATVLALAGAIWFTTRYPQIVRARLAAKANAAGPEGPAAR